jgi:hypothetical protein
MTFPFFIKIWNYSEPIIPKLSEIIAEAAFPIRNRRRTNRVARGVPENSGKIFVFQTVSAFIHMVKKV